MVGIDTPTKPSNKGGDNDSAIDGSIIHSEVEDEKNRMMADLEAIQSERGGGEWMKDAVQEAISQSQSTLSMVHGMSLGLKAEIDKPTRTYHTLTSPGAIPELMRSLSPNQTISNTTYEREATSPPTRRTHKSVMSPAVPKTVLSPPKKSISKPNNKKSESSTSNVAKQSWIRFCRVASDQFTTSELALISLDCLKALLKHYSLKDPIECARIEVYWRLLSIQRETKAHELDANPALNSTSITNSPAKDFIIDTPTKRKNSARRSGSGSSFIPMDHPRPFAVQAPQKGPHLSRRGSLRRTPALSCNPNSNNSTQYLWRTHSPGRSGFGSTGGKSTLRTFSNSSINRSHSQPLTYNPTSVPHETPSAGHPSKTTKIRTFINVPVGGIQTWEGPMRSGKKTGSNCNPAQQDAMKKSPAPEAIRTYSDAKQLTDTTTVNSKSGVVLKGIKINDTWRKDHLGTSSVETKNATAAARGRKSLPVTFTSDLTDQKAAGISAVAGLKCISKQNPALSDPNPNITTYATSDRKGKATLGLRVHDPSWNTSHHNETVPLGNKKPSNMRAVCICLLLGDGNTILQQQQQKNNSKQEGVQPPGHVDTQRRLHTVTDLHPPVVNGKEVKTPSATTTPLTPSFTPSASRTSSAHAVKRSHTPTKKKFSLVCIIILLLMRGRQKKKEK